MQSIIPKAEIFLTEKLKIHLHPNKVFIKTIFSGVDFLGWVNFSGHKILRGTTKRRMLGRIKESPTEETLQSYLGMLSHGNGKKVTNDLIGEWWLWK